MKKKFSIIIPVYNSEKTIMRCLTSITDTMLKDYEIIVIDDGSTDKSKMVIEEFAEKNKNIIILAQKNEGPSVARNRGLELAKGDIIIFIDSDDYVKPDYLQRLSETFDKTKADVIFYGFERISSTGDILSIHRLPILKENYFDNLVALSQNDVFGYTWMKAFRREVIGNTRFDSNIRLFEDEIFTCKIMKKSVNLFCLNEPLYCYVRNEETLANKTHQDYSKICDRVWNEWKELLGNSANSNKILEEKANKIIENCKWYMLDRSIKPFVFYQDIVHSDYIKYVTTCDDVYIDKLKKNKQYMFFTYYYFYKMKVWIAKILRKL